MAYVMIVVPRFRRFLQYIAAVRAGKELPDRFVSPHGLVRFHGRRQGERRPPRLTSGQHHEQHNH